MTTKRSVLIVLFSFLFISPLLAQISLTEDFFTSIIGTTVTNDSWTVDNTQSAGIQALLAIDGANQVWDFTSLTWSDNTKSTDSQDFIALPSGQNLLGENDARTNGATYTVKFPGSNGKNAAEELYAYFSTSPTEHRWFGFIGQDDNATVFDNLFDMSVLTNPFPLTFGSNWTSSATWTQNVQGNVISIVQDIVSDVSGWGTLVTPTGSFSVLRVNQEQTMTTTISGFPVIVVTKSIEFLTTGQNIAGITITPSPGLPGQFLYSASYAGPSSGGGGNPPATSPGNQTPSDGFQFTGDPTLAWDALAGATAYDLQVSTDPLFGKNGQGIVIDEVGLTGTEYNPAGLDPNTTYHWHVRGTNGDGPGPWSGSISFTTAQMFPGAVTLTAPDDAAMVGSQGPELSWDAASSADSYDVQVATDDAFTSIVTDLTGITGTAVSSGSLPWNDYFWRVRAVNTTGAGAWSETRKFTVHEVVSVEELDGDIPSSFALYPNYPNPFNPTTMIRFDVASTVSVRLAVYDALGRRVAQLVDRTMSAGSYEFSWDATGFESGFYLYRLQAGPYSKTGSMVLLK